MDLDKAIALVKPLIESCNFDQVGIITSEDQPEKEEGKEEAPTSYDVVVRDNLLTHSQLKRLNSLIEKSPEFHNISYQIWRSGGDHIDLYEVEEAS